MYIYIYKFALCVKVQAKDNEKLTKVNTHLHINIRQGLF